MAERPVKKNSRGEALKAYNETRKRMQEEKESDAKDSLALEEEQRTVASALAQPDDEIVKSITEIKLKIAKDLDSISEKRLKEFKKLSEIEKAVEIESKKLQELYEISQGAEALTALVRSQEEQRRKFDEEMDEKKAAFNEEMGAARKKWEKERQSAEEEAEENNARTERERKQEEEEYAYKTAKKRQAETDAYEQKKNALEKDLLQKQEAFNKEFGAREAALKTQEQELADLRKKTAAFPAEIDRVSKETEKNVRERIEIQYKHQAEILQKEIEGERKLHVQAIASLEAKTGEKDALILQLTKKTDETGRQIQDIAVKAIDGASKLRVIREYPEKENSREKA
ncbi:MAG TPA: hypothetical protein DCO75_01070 [Fibrobacteres bacterium]|nr:hypothetical protein [Fibrobacterota bacterium]